MVDVESREQVFHCARHPDVETVLRCGRCETPICPRCLVYTPVGARCPDCGKAGPNPVYQLPPNLLARAIGAGLGLMLAAAIAWAIVAKIWLLGFFILIVGAGIGYGIGAGLARAAKWRRGPLMMAIAAVAAIGGYILGLSLGNFLDGAPPAAAVLLTVARSFNLWTLIAVALSVVLAVSRVR